MRVTDPDEVRRLVAVEARAGLGAEVVEILARSGALLAGHFMLKDGQHSPHYIRFSQIGRASAMCARVAELLVASTSIRIAGAKLLSPESAGFFLAHALGRAVGAEDVAVAKLDVRRRPRTSLRVGQIVKGHPVVVVNDVVTSGASLEPLLEIARAAGAPVVGALAFGTLSDVRFKQFLNRHDLPASWLVSAAWQTHLPGGATCPQCAAGEELIPVAELS